jgi:hypothetical protein
MRIICATSILSLLIAAGSAGASTLYTNGPYDGTTNALTLTDDYSVADSFTLASNSTLTGLDFWVWILPGDVVTSIDYRFSADANGTTGQGSGTASNLSATYETSNLTYGLDIYRISFDFMPNLTLNAGTHWLTLSNAHDDYKSVVYWDQNGGPSQAFNFYKGGGKTSNPSEAFAILGGPATAAAPEPGSLVLIGCGMLLVAASRWRKPRRGVSR